MMNDLHQKFIYKQRKLITMLTAEDRIDMIRQKQFYCIAVSPPKHNIVTIKKKIKIFLIFFYSFHQVPWGWTLSRGYQGSYPLICSCHDLKQIGMIYVRKKNYTVNIIFSEILPHMNKPCVELFTIRLIPWGMSQLYITFMSPKYPYCSRLVLFEGNFGTHSCHTHKQHFFPQCLSLLFL